MQIHFLPFFLLFADATQDHADHVQDVMVALATILISSWVSWITARLTLKCDEKRAIREENIRLIEFAIEYPFLESDQFCSQWPEVDATPENKMRYENYCCHVFNVMEHAWELTKGDSLQLKGMLYPEELIQRHRKWWLSDPTNQKAYPVEFRQFVAGIIRAIENPKD